MTVLAFPAALRALGRDLDEARRAYFAHRPLVLGATEAEERAWLCEENALVQRLTAAYIRYADERHVQFLLRAEARSA